MPDQAYRLRELMHATAARPSGAPQCAPRVVAVAGAKGGVGATTIAVNVAIALAEEGRRTLLVDAHPQRADLAAQCGLTDGVSVCEVLAGRRSVHEAILPGPGGIQILAGQWAATTASQWTAAAQQQLICELKSLGAHADLILLDVGAAVTPIAQRFWRAADEVVLVTTPDSVSVMDGYAAVKTLVDASAAPRIATLVNQAAQTREAQDAHDRLQRACRRFLGIDARWAGVVPCDPAVRAAADAGQPLLVHAPDCAAAAAIMQLASHWHLAEHARPTSTSLQAASRQHSSADA